MKSVRLALGNLLAADAATLAPAVNGNKVVLVANNIALDENKVFADITAATFTGSTPLVCGTGTQNVGNDPVTGDQIVSILAPVGGFFWKCTVAPGVAETIYGIALCDNGLTTLLGLQKFDNPVTIAAVNDIIDVGDVTLTFVLQPMS